MGAFNPQAAEGIMCRSLLSIDHEGKLFDCDFNQMLGLPVSVASERADIFAFDRSILEKRQIRVGEHCFACTAGAGSSCGGATVTDPN